MQKIRTLIAAALIAATSVVATVGGGAPAQAVSCTIGHGTTWGSVKCSSLTPYTQARAQISCDHGAGGGSSWISAYGPWVGVNATSIAWCPSGWTRAILYTYQVR